MAVTSETQWCTSDPAEMILAGMRLSEERGDVGNLALRFDFGDEELRKTANLAQLEEYEALRRRAVEAFRYEATHGRGSLLRLDHPFTRQLIASGTLSIRSLIVRSPT